MMIWLAAVPPSLFGSAHIRHCFATPSPMWLSLISSAGHSAEILRVRTRLLPYLFLPRKHQNLPFPFISLGRRCDATSSTYTWAFSAMRQGRSEYYAYTPYNLSLDIYRRFSLRTFLIRSDTVRPVPRHPLERPLIHGNGGCMGTRRIPLSFVPFF
jgi:hypothetical protein